MNWDFPPWMLNHFLTDATNFSTRPMIVIVYSWTILDYQYYFYYERCKLYESVQFKEEIVLKSLRRQQYVTIKSSNKYLQIFQQ